MKSVRWGMGVAPRVVLLTACILSWAGLFLSLEMGRTTLSTLSGAWLIALFGATAALLLWAILFSLALRGISRLPFAWVAALLPVSMLPLLLSLPLLVGIYLSDDAFHFLTANPIPRSLALWTLPLLTLVWQEALLLWRMPTRGPVVALLSKRHAAPLLLFSGFAVLYLFTAGGHLYSPDENVMFAVTRNLAERGSVAIPHEGTSTPDGASVWYSKYGLVPSLLALPPYWISKLVGLEPDPPSPAFPIPNGAYPLVDLMVNPLATAATCSLLYCLARRLGFRSSTSLVVVLAYGLGTSAWVYSKTFFNQPPTVLFLLGGLYLLMRGERPSIPSWALAGVSLGLAVGCRVEVIALAVPLALPLAYRLTRFPRRTGIGLPDMWQALRLLIAFAVSLAATLGATVGWYNYAKTGSIFMTGHGTQGTLAGLSSEPWVGLFGTFFSPGFGLLVYNPLVTLGLFSLPLLGRKWRAEALALGGLIALSVLLYGSFEEWFGGFTWGNRYLMLILPFAVLPVAVLLEPPHRSRVSILLVGGAAVLGGGINLLAVLFDFNSGWLNLWDHRANLGLILWDPGFSPILAHLRLLHDYLYTGAKLDLYIFYKLGLPSLLAFLVLFTGLATLVIRAAWTADQGASRYTLTTGPGRS